MNMRLFPQSASPDLLNHIVTWSLLPGKEFALPPESAEHIPSNIRDYVVNKESDWGANVPLTATGYYLKNTGRAVQRLLGSLRIDLEVLNIGPTSPEGLDVFLTERRNLQELTWTDTTAGQAVLADIAQLHRHQAEAFGLFRQWMRARALSGRAAEGDRDIYCGRPEGLSESVEQVQRLFLARIGLARKAFEIGLLRFGDDKTTVISAAAAIEAFSDTGLRVEFDSMPLELSVRCFLDV